MKIRIEETVAAPAVRVFEVFSDIEHAEERIEGITKVEILSEARSGKGLRWRETRVMFGKQATEEMEITDFDPPRRYRVEAKSHGMHYVTDMIFEPNGESATKVTWIFGGEALSFGAKLFSVIGFLFVPMMKKALAGDVRALKEYIEANPG